MGADLIIKGAAMLFQADAADQQMQAQERMFDSQMKAQKSQFEESNKNAFFAANLTQIQEREAQREKNLANLYGMQSNSSENKTYAIVGLLAVLGIVAGFVIYKMQEK